MARFVSDDYGTRYNADRIAFTQAWSSDSKRIDVHFSGLEGDFRTARFRSEDSADAFTLDVCYGILAEQEVQ